MTTETAQPIDLRNLPIKDLANQAKSELNTIEQVLINREQRIPRALANIDLIDQIRKNSSIQIFLQNASRSVLLVNTGFLNGSVLLSVTNQGYELSWHNNNDKHNPRQKRQFGYVDKETLDYISKGEEISWPANEALIDKLSQLKPKQIIRKFRKALSKPVAVA